MAKSYVHNLASRCECGDHFWRKMNKWGVVLVSPEDADWIKNYHFSLAKRKRSYYCQSSLLHDDCGINLLHIALKIGDVADHIDGNGLDNRRSNLRPASSAENNTNTRKRRGTSSKYKGVSWRSNRGKWRAYVVQDGKQTPLGYFQNESDAAHAYDAAARLRFGDFAKLNFPTP